MRNFYNQNQNAYKYTPTSMIRQDYSGHEDMWAGYIMSELNFGKYITFIPGVRYDFSHLKYHAYSGENVPDSESYEYSLDIEKTTDAESFGYWLPQIHFTCKAY